MKTCYIRRVGYTEDGDVIMEKVYEATSFDALKEANRFLFENEGKTSVPWTRKNGVWSFVQRYVVDGAEVAIEASNDYWASMRHDPYDF
jgi:hypothetical protein